MTTTTKPKKKIVKRRPKSVEVSTKGGKPASGIPERQVEWQSPTGRWLTPGQTFKVRGESGTWKFRALVLANVPYVECVGTGAVKSIRCFDPERVYNVSKKVAR